MQILKFPAIGTFPSAPFLDMRCLSSGVPKQTTEKRTLEMRGEEVHYAGKTTRGGDISLNFIDSVDNIVKSFFTQWQAAVYNQGTGAGNFKSEYEGTILLTQLDNKDVPIWSYKMVGVFCLSAEVPDMAQTPGNIELNVTFSYDDFESNGL